MLPSYITNFFWPAEIQTPEPDLLKDPIHSDHYNIIASHLYIGNIHSLDQHSKFALIVNCTKHIEFPEKTEFDQTFLRISVDDHPSEGDQLLKYMAETKVLEKIHFCRVTFKQVLVHCHAGMQRSCAIVACYLMKYYKMNVTEAIAFIKEKRPIAFYNGATFMNAMNQFHMSLQK